MCQPLADCEGAKEGVQTCCSVSHPAALCNALQHAETPCNHGVQRAHTGIQMSAALIHNCSNGSCVRVCVC